jgi:hypothetical protein
LFRGQQVHPPQPVPQSVTRWSKLTSSQER